MAQFKELKPQRLYFQIIYVVVLIALISVNIIIYSRERLVVIKNHYKLLNAVADYKANQLQRWIKERINDGTAMLTNPTIIESIDKICKNKDTKQDDDYIRSRFANYVHIKDYNDVILVDTLGQVKLSVQDIHNEINPASKSSVFNALRLKQKTLTEMIKCTDCNEVYLDFIIPLSKWDGKKEASIGAVLFRVTTDIFIIPLMNSYPSVSKSSESCIFKIDNDYIVYMTELKYIKNSAFNYKIPQNLTNLNKEAHHKRKLHDYLMYDYRNVRVVSVYKKVEGTNWFVQVKDDYKDVIRPLSSKLPMIVFVNLLLALISGLVLLLLYKSFQHQYQIAAYRHEIDKQALTKHFEYLFNYANDIIILTDRTGQIRHANNRACDIYNYSMEELLQLNIRDLNEPHAWESIVQVLSEDEFIHGQLYETEHLTKDGVIIPVEVSVRTIKHKDEVFQQRIIRVITERKLAEKKIQKQNRLYSMLSNINQAIVRIRSVNTLYAEACRIVVEYGKYTMAYIGIYNNLDKTYVPLVCFGKEEGFLKYLHLDLNQEKYRYSSISASIIENRITCSNNLLHEPNVEHIQEQSLLRGYRSAAHFPIKFEGHVIGLLGVFSDEIDCFQEEDLVLFNELASDISFGLDNIERQNKLLSTSVELQAIFDSSPDAYIVIDNQFRVIKFNKNAELGVHHCLECKLASGNNFVEIMPQQFHEQLYELLLKAFSGSRGEIKGSFTCSTGSLKTIMITANPILIMDQIDRVLITIIEQSS